MGQRRVAIALPRNLHHLIRLYTSTVDHVQAAILVSNGVRKELLFERACFESSGRAHLVSRSIV
jgi:hypothetical protein